MLPEIVSFYLTQMIKAIMGLIRVEGAMNDWKEVHIYVVFIGHVDSRNSSTTSHLINKLEGIDAMESFEKELMGNDSICRRCVPSNFNNHQIARIHFLKFLKKGITKQSHWWTFHTSFMMISECMSKGDFHFCQHLENPISR